LTRVQRTAQRQYYMYFQLDRSRRSAAAGIPSGPIDRLTSFIAVIVGSAATATAGRRHDESPSISVAAPSRWVPTRQTDIGCVSIYIYSLQSFVQEPCAASPRSLDCQYRFMRPRPTLSAVVCTAAIHYNS